MPASSSNLNPIGKYKPQSGTFGNKAPSVRIFFNIHKL